MCRSSARDTHRQGYNFTNCYHCLCWCACDVLYLRTGHPLERDRMRGRTNWRVALAICAADTAAAETRSIDAVDRAADEVNREGLKVQKTHTLTQGMVLPEMCRNLPSDLDWGPWPWLGGWEIIIEVSKYGMNNRHNSRPTWTAISRKPWIVVPTALHMYSASQVSCDLWYRPYGL
jgi:hypothetical protein